VLSKTLIIEIALLNFDYFLDKSGAQEYGFQNHANIIELPLISE